MPTETAAPTVLPGDLVQVSVPRWQGAIVVVEEVRSWGVSGYAPTIRRVGPDAGPAEDAPVRLKHGEFVVVGVSAVASPDLAKARAAAIETARLVAAEAAPPAPEADDPDDLSPRFDVELRFNGRATGAAQKWVGRVKAECVGEALDQACAAVVRLPEHGHSIYVTGLTADEVKR